MYEIVVVDDDEIMREGLIKNIPWESYDFRITGSAGNGREGLQVIASLQPEIVITDIKMPFMDGLEMAEHLKTSYPKLKIVFLTGYDDFHYAKKALNLRASEYILKYADNDEILQTLLQIKQELIKERQILAQIDESEEIAEERRLRDILIRQSPAQSPPGLSGKNVPPRRYGVVVTAMDSSKISNENHPIRLERHLAELYDAYKKMLSAFDCWVRGVRMNQSVALIFGFDIPVTHQTILETIQRIKTFIPGYPALNYRIGIGNFYSDPAALQVSFQEALEALTINDMVHQQELICYEELQFMGDKTHQFLFKQIIDYIHCHFSDEAMTLSDIAEVVHISPSYICTLFKKYKQIHFNEYLVDLRMSKAKELLKKTDLKTYEIAEKIGYSNPQYFSVLFKKYAGCSPTEFRKCSFSI